MDSSSVLVPLVYFMHNKQKNNLNTYLKYLFMRGDMFLFTYFRKDIVS